MKQPETSMEAFNEFTELMREKDHDLIMGALSVLKQANYEQIAQYLGWGDRNKVSRRLKELELGKKIYKKGDKSLTSSKRNAYIYRVVSNGEISERKERVERKVKSASDYALRIINSCTQPTLFS